jgi:membrane protein DedA with SNARE-associated domain
MKISRPVRIILSVYAGLLAGLLVAFYLGRRANRNIARLEGEAWRELTDEELLA